MLKILDNSYYDLIINTALAPTYDSGDNITYLNRQNSLLHIPSGEGDPCDLGKYSYSSFPTIYTLASTISLEKSGISTVQANPYLALFGQGVLVAVIDTGIDYRHPAFLYNDGTSRILTMWDQTVQTGTIPNEFTFGSEYSREQINEALKSPDPLSVVPTTDENGHGTAMASILAGSPNEQQGFSGVVPQADLLIVKLKEAKQILKKVSFIPDNALCYQESDLILGVRYAVTAAARFNRPVVICIALGSSQGGHDGRGSTSAYVDHLSLLPGNGISVAAGNEGNNQRHYYNSTTAPPYYNDIELRVGSSDTLFAMEIWTYAPARLSIDISSPNRESTQPVYPGLNQCRKFNFIFNQTTIYVNNIIFEEETGEQLILLRFANPLPGIWYLRAQSSENESFSFHSWLPSGDLLTNDTFFLDSSPDTTTTSPGNARHVLTAAAYNQLNDSILAESGRGYTRSGQVKPDIAAPGFELTCAVPGGLYGTATGTGAAAAHAAGIIAMVFEWAIVKRNYPRITGNDVNRLMISGAVRNPANTYPNNIWGYGQVDINRLFERFSNI
ncbi:S8 family peptidase [Clostridium boliviensis]|uniref:S8 family peptidase n=1 Tax=Clostridium boliviensis TaxID=318465 RepID=A0ABU4GIW3_9CLOT|nr:S8 family peptidase [Clostridium boliviensis]MDW2796888.1 S8 family peptidase [Clostridium boliviensis]